ncbi:MAG: hypothetical protein KJZ85_19995 [Rhodobacteraceae bacterium]|jgi:hypothetical protein|nr:hypothetical protein [Paracoccaceae bacterium]
MSRLARRVALMAEIETTYGAGLSGGQTWGAALQVLPRSRPRHRIRRMNEARDLYLPFLGASDELVGPRVQEIEFEVEMAPSGAAGTAPMWGKLLRACQFAETVTADTRVEYTPVSDPGESLVLRYWEDGHAYVAKGCRGQVTLEAEAYKIPVLKFRFEGFDTQGTASAWGGPASPYAGWQTPVMPMDTTSGDIKLGCSYTAGALSGGTAYPSKGLTLDLGNTLTYDAILGGEKVVVTDRQPKGRMVMELSAAQEAAWRSDMNAGTETSMGWQLSTGAGRSIVLFIRRLQRQELQGIEENRFRRAEVNFGAILDKDDPNDDFMRLCVK